MRGVFGTVLAASVAIALGYVIWSLGQPDNLEAARQRQLAATTHVAAMRPPVKPAERPAAAEAPRGTAAAAGGPELEIDVARIDASGVSVLAGRAPAGQRVSIVANGREIGSAVASGDGQWSAIIMEGIAAGPLALELAAQPITAQPVTTGTKVAGHVTRSKPLHLVVPPGDGRAELAVAARGDRGVAGDRRQAAAPAPETSSNALARFEALVDRARDAGAMPVTGQAAPVPVPITFVSGEATMTPNGTKAASLLAEYLRLTAPKGIVLTGHADNRGAEGYNMELSRRRLEAIERYLRRDSYGGDLALLPKGEHEPYVAIDRQRLARDEVYQADRRVELRLTR